MASINTNLPSLTSQGNLKRSQSALATSMERLSSGLRINSAKDDAAGEAITNSMQAQRTGLGRLHVTSMMVSPRCKPWKVA